MDLYQGLYNPVMVDGYQKSSGQTHEYITFGPVPSGRIWIIENLSLEDTTSAFTSARILIRGKGYDHYIAEDYSMLAGRLYRHPSRIFVPEGCYLVVRFTGTTANDVLKAYLNGFEVKQPGAV